MTLEVVNDKQFFAGGPKPEGIEVSIEEENITRLALMLNKLKGRKVVDISLYPGAVSTTATIRVYYEEVQE